MLRAHSIATSFHEAGTPSCCHIHPSREGRVLVGCTRFSFHLVVGTIGLTVSNSKRRVLHAKPSEVKSRDRTCISNTSFALPSNASCEIDLLEQREPTNELLGFRVGILPTISTTHPRRWIAWRRGVLGTGRSCQSRNKCNREPHFQCGTELFVSTDATVSIEAGEAETIYQR